MHVSASGRCVALIDMDFFYCACERALDPSLLGLPMAVVQYNPYENSKSSGGGENIGGVVSLPAQPAAARVAVRDGRVLLPAAQNGSIIAVSYEARERGVTRFFRGREAVAKCPELVLVQVPTSHGKSDMGVYRDFGAKALALIHRTCGEGALTEKARESHTDGGGETAASVDEMYVDLTRPARALLGATSYADVLSEAAAAGTHVAGAEEAEAEAEKGAQPTGMLARNSFRAGHAGQVVRRIGEASAAWWQRTPDEWDEGEIQLAAGAVIVARARAAVSAELGFTCSAGIAANKLLAKLCGGLHKPNQQTLLPRGAVHALLDPLPIDRLRGFGGKLGAILREGRPDLGLPGYATAGELRSGGGAAAARLLRGEWSHPGEEAARAVRMASGCDDDAVRERPLAKQVGACKNFSGARGSVRGPIDSRAGLAEWASQLAEDIAARLAQQREEHGRIATTLVAHVSLDGQAGRSRRSQLRDPSACGIARQGVELLGPLLELRPPTRLGITNFGFSADSFEKEAHPKERGSLQRLFSAAAAAAPTQPRTAAGGASGRGRGRGSVGGASSKGAGRSRGGVGSGGPSGGGLPAYFTKASVAKSCMPPKALSRFAERGAG
ncbi:Translesion DNA polymerase-REV1 deoxycytidyl transferase [Emiliania huxleyi CCMP1516]|uniref:DNA polymerase eta n=2 Tax=Emiliania huxleyi TaxID=2903 RepID=A0A0D3IUU2_EMIH1|nr:Translesion DNA polymerase-REV1 deoxycytidyl transferase [Emiliania huxleyi CCMP1516]EOD15027.1 Translesion DNA polymerase-REV1 deoxycytidyl transferase [Emiliania huxleyi CCMP1516]|eukprot:XP_005767456.1 Translesion DNA polymerase-REV1 deoxycytidyl transferase [Emiliania huxleyi CCMP1516]